MKRDFFAILQIVLTASLLASGCSDTASTETGPDSVDPNLIVETDEEPKPKEGMPYALSDRSTLVYGMWLMYVQEESREVPVGVVGIEKISDAEPKQFRVQFAEFSKEKTLKPAEWIVKPTSVEISFLKGQQVQIFRGTLQNGVVYGNMIGGQGMCVPARLVQPRERTMMEPPEPHPVEGIHDFTEVMNEGAKWDDLVRFVEEHPGSPVIPNAIYSLALQVGPRRIPSEKVEELFALIDRSTILWGERMRDFVRLNTLLQLSSDYQNPQLLEKELASLEGKFEEKVWKAPVEFFMTNLKKDVELCQLVDSIRHAADEKERGEILEKLAMEREVNRFNVKLLAATAETLEEVSDKQSALEWYEALVVVPGMENRYLSQFQSFAGEMTPPSSQLVRLWKDVHGSEEGLMDSLDQEYEKLLSSYPLPEFELPEPNGKQVLIELFTGTACPPCTAADLAFSIVRDRLPQDRVILMQYHVHVPSIDPLTCKGSQARYGYYSPSGVPSAIVNGRMHDSFAGDASAVTGVLQPLLDEIVEELSADPILQIDAKVTPAADGTAGFEAKVQADQISDRWRLHATLAEGEVKFRGLNGVPVHDMVVRKLFTPSQGLEPTGDSLTVKGVIDPAAVRKELKEQMQELRDRRNVQFADGPLDLDDLFLVVFVQDVQNHRVRQVVSVPVPPASSETSLSE